MTRSAFLTSLALGAALAAASPASAVTISFTGSDGTDGTDGIVRAFSASGVSVQATGWDYSGNTLQKAYVGRYSAGLGVTNPNEGNGGTNNSHTVDNVSQKDFILLVFNQSVNITSAILSPFVVQGNTADNDATISYASAAGLFATPNPSTTAISTANPVFATLLANDWVVSGNNSGNYSTNLNSTGKFGNVWLIGAAFANPDNKADGFKLASITFNLAPPPGVPEPATWAMMIAGFGLVGAGMRRRTRAAVTA